MEFTTLYSGSSGNSTYISLGGFEMLVDCGRPMKEIAQGLQSIGKDISNISKIFITHEHSDHIACLGAILRKYKIDTYLTSGTFNALRKKLGNFDESLIHTFEYDDDLSFGDLLVKPIAIPHDASAPVCYKFICGDKSCLVATDIGYVTDRMEEHIYGTNIALLESNHDVKMLKNGEYPVFLQERILGKRGHLSNKSASDIALKMINSGTKHIILGHISSKNNTPQLAHKQTIDSLAFNGIIPDDCNIQVAKPHEPLDIIAI